MKRRIVLALALAGLIGAAVVNRIKPEQVAHVVVPAVETTDLLTTMSQMPAEIEVIEFDVAPQATLDTASEGAPEACARPELLVLKEYLKKDASQVQDDDDLLLEVKDTEHTKVPTSLAVEEKAPAMEPVKTMPEVTQSVEATPLPPMQAAPAVQDLKQDAVGRFGGGKFK